MNIDLYVDPPEDGAATITDEIRREILGTGIDAVVFVGHGALPVLSESEPQDATLENLLFFSGAVLEIGDACLWVMPPVKDTEIPADLGEDPAAAAQSLADSGWAVLLCNPYARELPGGKLRDRAMNLTGVHGLLSFVAAAGFEENLLAQELAMSQRKASAAGTGLSIAHPEFGCYFTLAVADITTQKDVVAVIRAGRVLAVESTQHAFKPIEAAMRPRDDNRRPRSGERDRPDGPGRQGRSGGGDRRPRGRDNQRRQ